MVNKKRILRHKNCGGFVIPDVEKSLDCMLRYSCPKCEKTALTTMDCDDTVEEIKLYELTKGSYVLQIEGATITFETPYDAEAFARIVGASKYTINELKDTTNILVTNGADICN